METELNVLKDIRALLRDIRTVLIDLSPENDLKFYWHQQYHELTEKIRIYAHTKIGILPGPLKCTPRLNSWDYRRKKSL